MEQGPAPICSGDDYHAGEGQAGPVEGLGMLSLAQAVLLPRASLTESCIIHRELPWPWSLLQTGMLVSALRQRSAPGATANRRPFAETTANCSQLGPRLEYSSARGTSPNAFRRMARNGGSGAGGRRPASGACPAKWGICIYAAFREKENVLEAPPGFHGSSSRDGAGIRGF